MACREEFFNRIIPESWKKKAMEMSNIRIATEYARDIRLNKEQRIKKIYYGYLGEFAFADFCNKNEIYYNYLGSEVTNNPDNGDFEMQYEIIIDVKTQESPYLPEMDWRCEVTDEQKHRLPHNSIYVFCKLYNESELFIVGWLPKKDFFETAKFHDKGILLRGKPVHYPKWDVTIEELYPIINIKSFLENNE